MVYIGFAEVATLNHLACSECLGQDACRSIPDFVYLAGDAWLCWSKLALRVRYRVKSLASISRSYAWWRTSVAIQNTEREYGSNHKNPRLHTFRKYGLLCCVLLKVVDLNNWCHSKIATSIENVTPNFPPERTSSITPLCLSHSINPIDPVPSHSLPSTISITTRSPQVKGYSLICVISNPYLFFKVTLCLLPPILQSALLCPAKKLYQKQ